VLDLRTGSSSPIGPGTKWAAWSPDGRWISAVQGKIGVLMDATDPSRRRRLTRADGPMIWSPDSKQVLLEKSQISCWASLYGVSLEAVDIKSGKRVLIRSSHCNVLLGSGGFWIASEVVRGHQ
jgi:hypothetical protein